MPFVRRFLIAVSLFLLAALVPANAGGLSVTSLGHSGFLFSDGKTKILVDTLTEPSTEWPYKAPSSGTLAKMERGQAPFDNVNLVLISHDHTDHYSPAATMRFMTNNPKAVLVTTTEVRDRLKTLPGFAAIEPRIVAPDLAWKQSLTQKVGGVTLTIDRLKHGDDKKWACMLDAFGFELGGKKVLYATATAGFFPEEYTELGYAGRGIDVAFLNFYALIKAANGTTPASLNTEGIAMVNRLIAPKAVVLLHITPKNAPSVDAMLPELQKQLPGTTVFHDELETRTF